jgi:hypothetical protein
MWFGIYTQAWLSLVWVLCGLGAIAALQSIQQENGKWPKWVIIMLWWNLFSTIWNLNSFALRQIHTAEIRYEKDLAMQPDKAELIDARPAN